MTDEQKSQATSTPLISRIEVDKLFYTYSYRLDSMRTPSPESGRLVLLYGNNGAGKTTILNLLYHLLHAEPFGGHRSFVGRIPFKSFTVHLANGVVVRASRENKYDPGPYHLEAQDPIAGANIQWTWVPDKTKRSEEEEPQYHQLCSFLQGLGITFHYLRDTRRVESAEGPRRIEAAQRVFSRLKEGFIAVGQAEDEEEVLAPERQLRQAIESAIQWFRGQALSGTNVGYTSVNSIYRDIIRRIVTYGPSQEATQNGATEQLVDDLIFLRKRNSAFAKFGLTAELDIEEIIDSLRSVRPEHVQILKTVLGPYLEAQKARLDALQDLQDVMNNFVSLLCRFYSHKSVTVHIEKGLDIEADPGRGLSPTALSSGEKQLLLLLCNAISARKDKTILMIDEPEISLNVIWQRELIPALLTCMSGTAFQVILATHSVELLSRYRAYVTPLENRSEEAADG